MIYYCVAIVQSLDTLKHTKDMEQTVPVEWKTATNICTLYSCLIFLGCRV